MPTHSESRVFFREKYFEGDVKFLVDAGLDGVKIDGCGGERDIGLYQQLLNKTETNFLIQDCHDSRASSDPHVPRAPPNATYPPPLSSVRPPSALLPRLSPLPRCTLESTDG